MNILQRLTVPWIIDRVGRKRCQKKRKNVNNKLLKNCTGTVGCQKFVHYIRNYVHIHWTALPGRFILIESVCWLWLTTVVVYWFLYIKLLLERNSNEINESQYSGYWENSEAINLRQIYESTIATLALCSGPTIFFRTRLFFYMTGLIVLKDFQCFQILSSGVSLFVQNKTAVEYTLGNFAS